MTEDSQYLAKAAATLEELMSIPFNKPCYSKNKNKNKNTIQNEIDSKSTPESEREFLLKKAYW